MNLLNFFHENHNLAAKNCCLAIFAGHVWCLYVYCMASTTLMPRQWRTAVMA